MVAFPGDARVVRFEVDRVLAASVDSDNFFSKKFCQSVKVLPDGKWQRALQ